LLYFTHLPRSPHWADLFRLNINISLHVYKLLHGRAPFTRLSYYIAKNRTVTETAKLPISVLKETNNFVSLSNRGYRLRRSSQTFQGITLPSVAPCVTSLNLRTLWRSTNADYHHHDIIITINITQNHSKLHCW